MATQQAGAGAPPTTRAERRQTGTAAPGRASIAGRTLRTDNWRRAPLLTFTLLSVWVLYALARTVSQRAYFVQATTTSRRSPHPV